MPEKSSANAKNQVGCAISTEDLIHFDVVFSSKVRRATPICAIRICRKVIDRRYERLLCSAWQIKRVDAGEKIGRISPTAPEGRHVHSAA
ncbi:MAG: hypothetical protein R2912_08580 [Eubacteriales bacterium]